METVQKILEEASQEEEELGCDLVAFHAVCTLHTAKQTAHLKTSPCMGTRRGCCRKSILNLCWWSAQIPHYSHGCIVTDFLIYYCLLYLKIKYLGKWTTLVCTLIAHIRLFFLLLFFKDSLRVWIDPWSWLPIIIDQSVRRESARPVQGQYDYCSMASTSRQSTGQSNCISHN